MDNDTERQKKQDYLRQEIIEQGYDSEQFANEIGKLKPEGENIDNWSIQELMKIVQQFKKTNQVDNQSNDQLNEGCENEQIKNNEIQEQYELEKNNKIIQQASSEKEKEQQDDKEECKKVEKDLQGFVVLDDQMVSQAIQQQLQSIIMQKYGCQEDYFEKTLQVDKHDSTIPIYEKIKITLSDPKTVSGGIFGLTSHYVLFKINTLPYNWEVRRKMKDFIWLRNVLCKLFPAKIIPPLDIKNTESDKHALSKRMKFLQNFINDLKYCQEIWTNFYVISFLSQQDNKKFEQIQKESEKEKEIDQLQNQISQTGQLEIKITNSKYTYKEELEKQVNSSEKIYQKLQLVSKQLRKDFTQVTKTLLEMGNLYDELFKSFNDFDNSVNEGKETHHKLKDILCSFNNVMISWAKSTEAQTKHVADYITHFFKYNQYETKSVRDLIYKTNDIEKAYIKYKTTLWDKKERQFRLTKDITKWEIQVNPQKYDVELIKKDKQAAFQVMYTKETQIQNQMRDNYGYYLNCVFEETQRIFQKRCEYYHNFFKIFSLYQTDTINEQIKQWGQIVCQYGNNPFPEPQKALQRQSSVLNEDPKVLNIDTKIQEKN